MATNNKKKFEKKIISLDQLALKEIRRELNLTLKEARKKIGIIKKGYTVH